MWIIYAIGSSFFAGITSILAKSGIQKTDSTLATAIRTSVVFLFSWFMVWICQSFQDITLISLKTLVFLILSGLATGASWLCYFKALQIGNINKIVPIDKSSTILTILLALVFLQEGISFFKVICVFLIGIGTILMIEKKDVTNTNEQSNWFIYALLSAIFASLTAILGKVGIQDIDSNLGTAIRTSVVLLMAWFMVFVTKKSDGIHSINKKELFFIILSGFATGASWLCYYKALQDGLASVVVPIDKLSMLITIGFSYIVFKERLSKKAFIGLCLITIGTITMVFL